MPINKYRGRKKFGPKRYRKAKAKVGSNVKRYVNMQLKRNIELKAHDTAPNDTTISSTPAFFDLLFGNAQGTSDAQQRVGDTIILKTVSVKFQFTAADATNVLRVVLLRWLDDDGVNTPTAAQVFVSITGALAVNSAYLFDAHKQHRFSILFDRRYNVDTDDPQLSIGFGKLLHNAKVQFANGTSAGRGKIYMCLVSDSLLSTHPATALMYTRITYTDA